MGESPVANRPGDREPAGDGPRTLARMGAMSAELPVGFQWRRPAPEDAEAIFAVIDRHNTPLVGSADITLMEVRDELSEPGFDPHTDAWLVGDDAGVDVAYGWAYRQGRRATWSTSTVYRRRRRRRLAVGAGARPGAGARRGGRS